MTPPPSLLSGTPKRIFWLFLDPVNPDVLCQVIKLSDHDWATMRMGQLIEEKLPPEMQAWFRFHPDLSTLKLWSVTSFPRCSFRVLNPHSA